MAVSINQAAMSPQEKQDVAGAAANTVGISEDKVVVINMEFSKLLGLTKPRSSENSFQLRSAELL